MNANETAVARVLEAEGFRVLRHGWPDFLCIRGDELVAIEVKAGGDFVRQHQERMHQALRLAGIPTYVVRAERPTEFIADHIAHRVATLNVTPECAARVEEEPLCEHSYVITTVRHKRGTSHRLRCARCRDVYKMLRKEEVQAIAGDKDAMAELWGAYEADREYGRYGPEDSLVWDLDFARWVRVSWEVETQNGRETWVYEFRANDSQRTLLYVLVDR